MDLFKGISVRAAMGFACQQGFLYSVFYLGSNRAVDVLGVPFERIDLLLTFLFMVLPFALVRLASARAREALLAPTLVGWYSVLLVIGSLLVVLPFDAGLFEVALECVLMGLPLGLLLCAWGRALSMCPHYGGAREVLLSTAVGAAACLVVAVVPIEGFQNILKLLPIGSAWALRSLAPVQTLSTVVSPASASREEGADEASGEIGKTLPEPSGTGCSEDAAAAHGSVSAIPLSALLASAQERTAAVRLSVKVVAGTALFGVAGGFMEVFSSEPGMASQPTFPATLIILVLFCIAAAQLFVAMGGGSDEDGAGSDAGSLAGSYRLAVLLTMAGYLFVPVLGGFGVPGQAIVLAGHLGLASVLMTLFMAIARASAQDGAIAFARGLLALFLGEALGIALGNAVELLQPGAPEPYAVAACAGLTFLFAYLFLFTERDYAELTAIAGDIDTFDEACKRIAEKCGLSKREAEVLPLALRGRTSERIAGELFIAKSTADTHLRRIYAKTGVHSRQELIDLGERVQKEMTRR